MKKMNYFENCGVKFVKRKKHESPALHKYPLWHIAGESSVSGYEVLTF